MIGIIAARMVQLILIRKAVLNRRCQMSRKILMMMMSMKKAIRTNNNLLMGMGTTMSKKKLIRKNIRVQLKVKENLQSIAFKISTLSVITYKMNIISEFNMINHLIYFSYVQ